MTAIRNEGGGGEHNGRPIRKRSQPKHFAAVDYAIPTNSRKMLKKPSDKSYEASLLSNPHKCSIVIMFHYF